ncbi:MAG: hypothetical protein J7M32_06110, partial [Deltaproteobacteria bacterium]|nr:hypothetical protein [Deltaproteobacteria bacterium]
MCHSPCLIHPKRNSSINGGRRVFLTRLPGGRRLFETYQWGKPQLDEVGNAKGASLPAIALLPMLLPSAIADPRDESLGKNAQL